MNVMTRKSMEEINNSRLLNLNDLMMYIGVGRNKAIDFGKESSSIVRIGRRVLYDRERVDKYIDSLLEEV